jgi:hypothetical protein
MTKAITDVVAETRLAYEFCPGSYTASALNAVLADFADIPPVIGSKTQIIGSK